MLTLFTCVPSAYRPFFDGGWSCQGHGLRGPIFFFRRSVDLIPTTLGPFLPRAGAVKDANLRAHEGVVLDCSEHGRTMMECGVVAMTADAKNELVPISLGNA